MSLLKINFLLFQSSMEEWRLVFWITVAVLVATNVIFVVLGSGEVQHWNEPVRHEVDTQAKQVEGAETQVESFRYIPEQ